jgi:hypothetical protein
MTASLSSFAFWSPTHGAEVTRFSMADDLGQEFYAFTPSTEGSVARRLREKAASKLEEAIGRGCEPGEIRWRT